MRSIILKNYKRIFKGLVSESGFRQKNDIFFKLQNNNIIHTICIQFFSLGHAFTFNIGILPICIGIEDLDQLKVGNIRLGHLYQGYDYWWEYDLYNSKDDEVLILDAYAAVKSRLLPIVEKITDYEKYLYYIDEIEKEIFGSSIENSHSKLWVNLKLQHYQKAKIIIDNVEKQNHDAALANKPLYTEEKYKIYLQNMEERIVELKEIRDAIQKNDTEFIKSLLKRNEEISKALLDKLVSNKSSK